MEKNRSLSIAVRGLFVSAFFSTIFGVANASAYTVTYNANGALFDNGQETNVIEYDDEHNVVSGGYKDPVLNNPSSYDFYWSLEESGKTELDLSKVDSDITVYAQYHYVIWDYGFTGNHQSFVSPMSKKYILEAWGAQGGLAEDSERGRAMSGKGGFSIGAINLTRDAQLFVTVGGQGESTGEEDWRNGGYNGGGKGYRGSQNGVGGGGATHISKTPALLTDLFNSTDTLLMVAGGGGGRGRITMANGVYAAYDGGGSGGGAYGIIGLDTNGMPNAADGYNTDTNYWFGGFGGSQTAGGTARSGAGSGSFGQGGNSWVHSLGGNGGGGGYYGGSGSNRGHGEGGGGSGYLSDDLYDKYMVSYVTERDKGIYDQRNIPYVSDNESAKTYTTLDKNTTYSAEPMLNAAKLGDGAATIMHKNILIKYVFDADRIENYLYDYAYIEEDYITLDNLDLPDRIGYTKHWFVGDEEWDFSKKVNYDVTLTATYLPITYNLTYNLGDGTLSEPNPDTYTVETDDITLNNPNKDYYDFIGWSGTDLSGKRNTSVTIAKGSTGNRSYEANYTAIPYTITYNLDGGTNNVNNPATYTYESNEINVVAPTREGYTFTGWSGTDLTGEDNMTITIPIESHGNREYTAHWSINQYTATFDVNGGTAIDPSTITSDYGVAFGTLPVTSRTGYDFDGWFTEQTGGDKISDATTMPAEDHTYYAHWTIQTFNISYDLNGGELAQGASNPDTYTYESADINLAKPSREGYTFLGWSGADLTNNTEDVTIAHNSLGDRSYKAEFQINEYTATFDANAGETADPETITKNYNEELGNLPSTSRLGYKFLGWFTDATAGDEITDATKMPAGDVTYYAHWEIIVYTIEYDLGGEDMDSTPSNDSSNPTSYTVEDADITLKAATPGDTWHYFVGWALDRDTEDGLTDNFVIDTAEAKNIKVYAIFQANPYTVTLDPGNGDDEIVKTVRGDQEIGELPTPERAGYEFLGWFVGDKQIDEHFHPRSDSIAVARWEEIPTVPDTGANSTPNTGDAIMNHIVTFAVCAFALFIVVALRKRKAKNEA